MGPENRRSILTVFVIALLIVAIVTGGLTAATVVSSDSSTQVSIATSEVGDRIPEPDEVVLYVESTDDSSEAIGERVADGFQDRGKRVTIADELEDDYDDPLVVISIDRSNFDRGLTTRAAAIDVSFYYSTAGTTAQWRQYQAGDSIVQNGTGAVVVGEIHYQDQTKGITTTARYRTMIYETIADEILDNYRGALDGP